MPSAVIGILFFAAGCSSEVGPGEEAAATYEKPGWMAEEMQWSENLQASQATCLTSHGLVYEEVPTGGFLFPSSTDSAAIQDAMEECTRAFVGEGYGAKPTPEQLEYLYEQMLDVRLCLINEGYEIEEPISKEAFIESEGQWTVYSSLPNDADLTQLQPLCPQPLGRT